MALGAVYNCSLLTFSDIIGSLSMLKQRNDLKLVILLTEENPKLKKEIKKMGIEVETVIIHLPKGRVEKEAFLSAIVSNLKSPNRTEFLKDYLRKDMLRIKWKFLFFPKNLGLKERKEGTKTHRRNRNRRNRNRHFPSEVVGGVPPRLR